MHAETNRKESDLNAEVVVTFPDCVTGLCFIPSNIIPKLLLNAGLNVESCYWAPISELSQ